MNKIRYTFYSFLFFTCSFGQIKALDFEKFKDCKLTIEVNYKDRDKDFSEAQKFKDIEIILIHANKDGKVKSFERGYILTIVKDSYKGTFFETSESKSQNQHIAKFPLFEDKCNYCYNAKCFDTINFP
ncbi:MAG: hypothetical protein ABIU77_18615 [Ferruginibacter sp.]